MPATRVAQITGALVVFGALAVQPAAAQWTPPIGIPAPSFGITNVAPAVPNPWTVSTPGFYYVEPGKTASTDTSNTYGTPAKPRKTIPTSLPAGSVVELHGTYDFSHSSPATIVANGTASAPVYIRGVSAASRPLARSSWEVRGSYMIIENIEFGPLPDQSDTGSMVILLPADHIAVRHNDIHGLLTGGGLGIVNWEVPYGVIYTGTGYLDNIVVWDNSIHDNGDLNATYDQDVHGISVSDHVRYLWIVDNQIARNSGDGMQINASAPEAATTHHIYVGRNVSHNNKQSGFWVKSASDVILSQNESYGHRPSNSSLGQCMGGQYGPDWVWYIYNHAHDCEYGITQMSDNQEPSHWFLIGNVIENIHRSQASDPSNSWGPSAIMMSGGNERHIINNTIYNTDSGVNISSPVGTLEIGDNIISTITQPLASHILLGFVQIAANTNMHHNLLFGDPRIDKANGQFRPTAAQMTAMQSISTDPQFMNPTAGDFHIPSTSPARGTAQFNATYATFQSRYGISIATDADGYARPQGSTTDMGAYLANGTRNTPPTISTMSPQTINEDTATATLSFTVGDVETPAANLTVTATSSNVAIVPNTSITLGGSGATRTVSVVPAANQSGMLAIVISVSDGTTSTLGGFVLTVNPVNDPPTITALSNQMTTVGKPKGPLTFSVSDAETPAASLTMSGSSSNTLLVPNANLVFGGSGGTRTLTVTPVPGRAGQTTITVGVSDGSLTASTSFTLVIPAGTGDFDGDGRADVLLRNKATGQDIGWLMNGIAVSSSTFMPTIADTNWEIKGVGDFDGDGKADVILRNKATGQDIGWLMNGLTVSRSAFLPTLADINWEIKGVGDFNGDGKADVILRHKTTGQNVAWLMNGLTIINSAFLPTLADTNWEISGVGDFDGDGKADVILRHKVTGQNVVWLMNGLTVSNSAFLPTVADANWEIRKVGDLDGDGKADVLLRNKSTGQTIGWLMNGLTVRSSAFLTTIADTNWDIRAIGDFNGDGKADVLWRNKVTGENLGWLMDGLTVTSSVALPTIADTNWDIVGP